MLTFLMFALLVVFILIGAPIGFVMAILPMAYILVTDAVPMSAVPYQMYDSLGKIPLIAVPLFLLAGELMNRGEITNRLLALSRVVVGPVRGGLSQVTVVLSMLFATLNGSAVASTVTIGSIMIPAMKQSGYGASYSAALTGAASTIGAIIPPSLPFIIFASATNLSVGRLFSAGVLPGVLIGLMFMAIAYVVAVRNNYERYDQAFSVSRLLHALNRSVLALMLPLILYFGIVLGIFSATEAGALVAFLAFIIGKFIYKSLSWQDVHEALKQTVRGTASIFIIIAAAGPFAWLLTRLGALSALEDFLLQFKDNKVLFICIFIAIIFVAGMLMDIVANLLILGPTMLAASDAIGLSSTQAAMVICIGFILGAITPPVGICYFAAARIAKVRLEPVAIALVPFIVAETLVLFLIFTFPPLVEWLPKISGY